MRHGPRLLRLAPCALFAVLATQGAIADWRTNDEGPFLHYGLLHLRGSVPRSQTFDSKLPVTALHAVPVLVAETLSSGPRAFGVESGHVVTAPWALACGRGVAILLGSLLVYAIGLGASALAGPKAGAAASLLAALEPNLLAHGHLVTADGGAALATFLLALATARFTRTRRARDAALIGGALGLVLLCKFMLLVWVGLVLAAILAARAFTWRGAAVALVASVAVVNLGFFLRGVPGQFPERPRSAKVARLVELAGRAPLPLPASYLEGVDWTAADEEQGKGFGNLYLLGETQTERRGWASYYLVAFALKLPLPLLALALAGFAWNRGRDFTTLRVLAAGWFVFLSLVNHAQIGIRHALPVVPLLVVEAGCAYARLERARPWLARALVVWLGASVVSFAPDFIPYTNELVPDRRLAWRFLADSNLDWGQANVAARDYLSAHPDVVSSSHEPRHGKILISANALTGVTEPPERWAWLREETPVAHVRHAFLLFDVP
jgi:hypothetical protein